jgi:hypothetical protein
MFYSYETDAGKFVLERQRFTEGAWQLLFNGRFIDSYPSPFEAALSIAQHGVALLAIEDAVLLPPASLTGWDVHWCRGYDGDAPELWLHHMYLGRGAGTEGQRAGVLV